MCLKGLCEVQSYIFLSQYVVATVRNVAPWRIRLVSKGAVSGVSGDFSSIVVQPLRRGEMCGEFFRLGFVDFERVRMGKAVEIRVVGDIPCSFFHLWMVADLSPQPENAGLGGQCDTRMPVSEL